MKSLKFIYSGKETKDYEWSITNMFDLAKVLISNSLQSLTVLQINGLQKKHTSYLLTLITRPE